MTPGTEAVRIAYVEWVRRSAFIGVVPVFLIAAEQIAVRADFWGAPGGGESLRYLFWAAAVAGVFLGKGFKKRGPRSESACTLKGTRSLSWTLVSISMLPVSVGFVLSVMTREAFDFFTMLLVSLGAYVMLFPHYPDWLAWASAPDAGGEDS